MSRAFSNFPIWKDCYRLRVAIDRAIRQLETGASEAAIFSIITFNIETGTPAGRGGPPRLLICWMAESGSMVGVVMGIEISLLMGHWRNEIKL